MSENLRIIFIPLDDRPVSYSLPQQIAGLNSSIDFLAPPREYLGNLVRNSDVDRILLWLDETLNVYNPDYIVVSLDTIAYGGLIPSRRGTDTAEEIIGCLNKFKNIVEKYKNKAKIFGFSSIMRISDSYVNEEEKEYWNKFGKEIFNYSYYKHKIDASLSSKELKNSEQQRFNEFKNKIPPEILENYLKTRERNFSINRFYLNWIENEFLDYLVFSKDDTGQFGLNVQEAEALESEIKDKNFIAKAIVQTGADEIPSDLVCRSIVDNFGQKIKVFPGFSTENGGNIISRYEDRTISECASSQIRLCGGDVADSLENADIILLMHTPENIQNDHCLNVHSEPENKNAVNFCIDFIKNSQKPLIIGDISCANGGDNLLVMQILGNSADISKIYGYAGWNTTGNTLGSVISIGISRLVAEKENTFDLNVFKKTLLVRLADDWAYQTIVRQKIRAITSIADEKTLKEELSPLVLNVAKKLDYSLDLSNFELSFPWNRTFEVEIVV